MSFWNPDKECDRPSTSEYYDAQDEIRRLKKEIERLTTIIEEQDNNRLKLARSC